MLVNVEKERNNEGFNFVRQKLTENEFNAIKDFIENAMHLCKKDAAISLASIFGSDWGNTPMQVVYEKMDKNIAEAAKYAGIIMKEIIYQNKDYCFEQVSLKNGSNCYYKR